MPVFRLRGTNGFDVAFESDLAGTDMRWALAEAERIAANFTAKHVHPKGWAGWFVEVTSEDGGQDVVPFPGVQHTDN